MRLERSCSSSFNRNNTHLSQTQIESETPFAVIRIMHDGKTDLFCSGIYKDIFLIDSNKALLKERIVICDSNQIDTLLAIPL